MWLVTNGLHRGHLVHPALIHILAEELASKLNHWKGQNVRSSIISFHVQGDQSDWPLFVLARAWGVDRGFLLVRGSACAGCYHPECTVRLARRGDVAWLSGVWSAPSNGGAGGQQKENQWNILPSPWSGVLAPPSDVWRQTSYCCNISHMTLALCFDLLEQRCTDKEKHQKRWQWLTGRPCLNKCSSTHCLTGTCHWTWGSVWWYNSPQGVCLSSRHRAQGQRTNTQGHATCGKHAGFQADRGQRTFHHHLVLMHRLHVFKNEKV